MNTPKVSVCVPLYNGEKYLDDCLRSISDQSFNDFECVIIDDCSTDDGAALARRWSEVDHRFRVYSNKKNLGLVGNWNRCIELGKGEWLKFLFQDDLMAPNCLAEMVASGQSGGGFVACSREFLFENPIDPKLRQLYIRHADILKSVYLDNKRLEPDAYSKAKLDNLAINMIGEPSVTMIRKSLFTQFGSFDPLLVQLCDSEMWNRLGSNVGVDYIQKNLVSFRVHSQSTTQSNRNRFFRTNTLEEIIEVSRLCYSPALKRFRLHARSSGKWLLLRKDLMKRVNWAFELARQARRRDPADHSLTQDIDSIMPFLPGYFIARVLYFSYSVRRVARGAFKGARNRA